VPGRYETSAATERKWQRLVSSSCAADCSQVPEAHALYRQVLASQPDGSVVIAAHGFLVNLQHLLNSTADKYSALSGVELVRKKVKKIAVMGGQYPRSYPVGTEHHTEWNFGGGCVGPVGCPGTPPKRCTCPWSSFSSAFVTEHWPKEIPMVFSGFELGSRINTGTRLLKGQDCPASVLANPCRQAFADFSAVTNITSRQSWDSVTSLFAVRGPQAFETASQAGRNLVNATDGSDVWSTDGAAAGVRQSYLILNETTGVAALENAIDDLICAKPSSWQ
jgi:pyrimidine-specific ribonucleoside hydrolase